ENRALPCRPCDGRSFHRKVRRHRKPQEIRANAAFQMPVEAPTPCATVARACLICSDIHNVGNKRTGSTTMNHPMKILLAGAVSLVALCQAAAAAATQSCDTVRFSDVGWSDITATTATVLVLLKALGYETDVEVLSVPVTYSSLKNKDIDV